MRITKLDGLRGVFSLMVIFHHFTSEVLPKPIYENFFIRQSWLFVDLFFIMSGFVIALNYQTIENLQSLLLFIKKRLIRIYPLLFFSTISFLLFKLSGIYFYNDLINTPGTLRDNINLTLDTLLLTNSTPVLGTSPGLNYPSWSISSEMISYLLYGLILLIFTKKHTAISFILVIISSIVFLLFIDTHSLEYTSDFGFLRGFIGFFIGVLVYKFNSHSTTIWNNIYELFTIPIIIFCFYLMSNKTLPKNLCYIIPILLGMSILIITRTNGTISNFLEKKQLQFLGKISYSVYLNHGLIILIIPRIIFNILKFENNSLSQILTVIISTTCVIIFSNFTYHLIEKRFGHFLKKRLL